MKVGIVIQARLGSTRLPGKMLLPFHDGLGILELILVRLSELKNIPIIVATSTLERDDAIIEISEKHGFSHFRGSENNVLDRFIQAAKNFELDGVIRVCADNPLLDIKALKQLIDTFQSNSSEYTAFFTSQGKPSIQTHYGFWAEAVRLDALLKIAQSTEDPIFLEHVTNYIYKHPESFTIQKIPISDSIENESNIRLTLDTKEDFSLLQDIYNSLLKNGLNFEAESICSFVSKNDTWRSIMKGEIAKNNK